MSLTPLGQQILFEFSHDNPPRSLDYSYYQRVSLISPSPTNCSELVVIFEKPKKFGHSCANEHLARVYWTGFTPNLEWSQPFLIARLHLVTFVLGHSTRLKVAFPTSWGNEYIMTPPLLLGGQMCQGLVLVKWRYQFRNYISLSVSPDHFTIHIPFAVLSAAVMDFHKGL